MSKPIRPLETLKALRHEMGLSQSRFAELIQTHARNFKTGEKPTVSVDTIKNLEYGKLQLSEDMAERIAAATGISMKWLDGNDRNAQKAAYTGEPWSKHLVVRKHAPANKRDQPPRSLAAARFYDAFVTRNAAFAARFLSAVLAGCSDNPMKLDAANFRLVRFLEKMKEDFGWSQEEYERGSAAFRVAERRFQKASDLHLKSLFAPMAAAGRATGMTVKIEENQIEVRMTKRQEAAAIRRMKKKARNQANTGTRASS